MSDPQRKEVIRLRRQCKLPWHSPPHYGTEPNLYHITAACYEHACVMNTYQRMSSFETLLISELAESNIATVRAWVILPNHYHLLVHTSLPKFGKWLHRLHNKTATKWNGEDQERGRKVWHRYADRRIRGDIHYFRTLNYIHANPVKHGYVDKSGSWPWSSFSEYEEKVGRDKLVQWWREYPITGYGDGWDD